MGAPGPDRAMSLLCLLAKLPKNCTEARMKQRKTLSRSDLWSGLPHPRCSEGRQSPSPFPSDRPDPSETRFLAGRSACISPVCRRVRQARPKPYDYEYEYEYA